MSEPHRFLVIDDNTDSRMLLVKTILRKFPDAALIECQNGDTAIRVAASESLNAVVAHRTFEYDGETLIRLLRRANAEVPIVMVSGHDRSAKATEAGADAFLNYDAWLQIGVVVAGVMTLPRRNKAPQRAPGEDPSSLAEPEFA